MNIYNRCKMNIYNRCNQYLLLALAVAAPSLAFAAKIDGNVNFTGSINDSTCALDVDGGGGSSGSIDLGHIDASSFSSAAGDVSTKVGFSIKFSNCNRSTQSTGTTQITFSGPVDPVNNKLLAIPGGITKGYAIGLYDKNKNLISLNTSSSEGVSGSNSESFFKFYANYVTTGIARNRVSGPGSASMTFSVNYQ